MVQHEQELGVTLFWSKLEYLLLDINKVESLKIGENLPYNCAAQSLCHSLIRVVVVASLVWEGLGVYYHQWASVLPVEDSAILYTSSNSKLKAPSP